MLYRAKSPLRISFCGGGTDVPPFPELEGGCVLSATINKYTFGTLNPRADLQINIGSLDYGVSLNYDIHEELPFDGNLDLVKAAIKKFLSSEDECGFDLFLHSSVPPGSGLGSSAAMTATLVGLLKEFKGNAMETYEIADVTYKIEREDLGISGGYQDQYATVFGGMNFIEFFKDTVVVNPLRVKKDILNELEYSLVLCYTGGTRFSARIIEDQTKNYLERKGSTVEALRRLKELTIMMKNCLLQKRLTDFGSLLDEIWIHKKNMSDRITTPRIDEMYEEAKREGVLGGKLLGAGGGGYLLFYCPYDKKHKIIERMKKMGGVMMDFAFDDEGLQTWKLY